MATIFAAEQEQLRQPHCQWLAEHNLDTLVPKAAQDVHFAAGLPACVILLLDDERAGGYSPEIEALIQQKLSVLRDAADKSGFDFALGNQPQYVCKRVQAHTIPEGWNQDQYKIGDLPRYTSLTPEDLVFVEKEAARLRAKGWKDALSTARQIVDNAWRAGINIQFKQHLVERWLQDTSKEVE